MQYLDNLKDRREFSNAVLANVSRFLSMHCIMANNSSDDGRHNSAFDEESVLKEVEKYFTLSEFPKRFGLRLILPKFREWYDFAIENKDMNVFIPINIKSTTGAYYDNTNCKLGLFYFLTGVNPSDLGLTNNMPWEQVCRRLDEHYDVENDGADYYFLIVNKKNTSDVFYTSLSQIKTLVPKSNNLPFQCKWFDNRELIDKTLSESRQYVLETFEKGLIQRVEILSDVLGSITDIKEGLI